jgi:hypothetical protein
MTEEKRILTVNPADFNMSSNNNTTRKKKTSSSEGRIKMKPPKMPKRNETLRKKALLRMIRSEQQRNLDEITQQRKEPSSTNATPKQAVPTNEFHSSFNKATSYLDNLVNKSPSVTTPTLPSHNHTIKNRLQDTVPSIPTLLHPSKPIPDPLPELKQVVPSVNIEEPEYGCLKNGNLPTYRSWLNKTQSNKPPLNWDATNNNDFKKENFSSTIPTLQPTGPVQMPLVQTDHFKLPEYSEPEPLRLKGRKQKRRVVRTHKLGRSKYYSKIGVLISNKTIRNKVVNQKQQLKKVPIRDVRKYLIKQGFIKIGSDTPSDVLREMYESSLLMCGEVKNNNVDTLLHNFLHTNDD